MAMLMHGRDGMRMAMGWIAVLMVGLSGLAAGSDAPDQAENAPAFVLKDLKGKEHRLADYAGKIVVLEWTHFDCPWVKMQYRSGNFPALQKRLRDEDAVVWLTIASGRSADAVDLKNHVFSEESNAAAILLDESGAVGRAYGAVTTPHVFVISAEGKVVYDGAPDEHRDYEEDGVREAESHLVKTVVALKADRPVPVRMSKPYGCAVMYRE